MSDLVSAEDIIEKDILELIGADKLSVEQKAELYEQMNRTVNYRLLENIENQLETEEEKNEWKKLLNDGSKDDVAKFLEKHRIDLEKAVADEAIKYKVEVVSIIKGSTDISKVLEDIYKKFSDVSKKSEG